MFIKNYGSPLAAALAGIFLKKNFYYIAYSAISNDTLLQIKLQNTKYNDIYDEVIGENMVKKISFIFNDINHSFIKDVDIIINEDRIYDLLTNENYYTSDSILLMFYQTAMNIYKNTSIGVEEEEMGNMVANYLRHEIGKNIEDMYQDEIGEFLYKKVCEFYPSAERGDDSFEKIVGLLCTGNKAAMTKFITGALDFGIPDYILEDFPEKDRMITALEIGYVLLKYVPVLHDNFSDIILPKLLSSLYLSDNDNAAEKITTRLNQLKDTFQVQNLITDDINQYLQTL